jgi:nucleoside-diphosphate-sugar epimerase
MDANRRVLVTGATGFVGRMLCEELSQAGYLVRAALRSPRGPLSNVAEAAVVGEIGSKTDWTAALQGVDAVVHLAARVHVMEQNSIGNLDPYLEANTRGTERLASAAIHAGVRKLVYISSVKVNGEETKEHLYAADDEPQPRDGYGVSKWRAEQALRDLAAIHLVCFSVIRPTLVYGPGVRANFLRLVRWVDKGVPLPLGAVKNRRSLVNVWNLCDLIRRLLEREHVGLRTWMVSDGDDVSTPELIRRIAGAMDRPARLPAIPTGLLLSLGTLLGRTAEVRRLCGSLAVDISATRRDLDWSPPVSMRTALERTVQWYLNEQRGSGA